MATVVVARWSTFPKLSPLLPTPEPLSLPPLLNALAVIGGLVYHLTLLWLLLRTLSPVLQLLPMLFVLVLMALRVEALALRITIMVPVLLLELLPVLKPLLPPPVAALLASLRPGLMLSLANKSAPPLNSVRVESLSCHCARCRSTGRLVILPFTLPSDDEAA